MGLTTNYLYIILLVIILILLVCLNLTKKVSDENNPYLENFDVLSLPSLNQFFKLTTGYQCDDKLDNIQGDFINDYPRKLFCDQYPDTITLEKISKSIIDEVTTIDGNKIVELTTSDLNVNDSQINELALISENSMISNDIVWNNYAKNYSDVSKLFCDSNSCNLEKSKQHFFETGINENKVAEPSADDPNFIGSYELMQDECRDKCYEDKICEYSITGNSQTNDLGKCYLYKNTLPSTDISDKGNFTIQRKIHVIQYSLGFWINISQIKTKTRNIFRHGDTIDEHYPSIYIEKDSKQIVFTIKTSNSNEIVNIDDKYITLSSWNYITLTVSGQTVNLYVNGKKINYVKLKGYAEWPSDKKVVISDEFNSYGEYQLNKMVWFPFELTHEYVKSLAYYADQSMSQYLSQYTDPNSLNLVNGWKSLSGVKVIDVNDVIYLSGIITGGSINTLIGTLAESKRPDRDISMMIGGSNGAYLARINKAGQIYIYDQNYYDKSEFMSKFVPTQHIYLSNIRFPLLTGTKLEISSSLQTDESEPGYYMNGSMVYLTGGYIDEAKTSIPFNLPSKIIPARLNIFRNITSIGNVSLIAVKKTTGEFMNVSKEDNIKLEGINYSTFNGGTELTLNSDFNTLSTELSSHVPVSVFIENNIVVLNGCIKKVESSTNMSYQSDGYKNTKTTSGLTKMSENSDLAACAASAGLFGNRFFSTDDNKTCYTGNYYNSKAPSWNDFVNDMIVYPSISLVSGQLVLAKNNVIINSLILYYSSIFTKNSDGTVNVSQSQYTDTENKFPWDLFYTEAKKFKIALLPTEGVSGDMMIVVTPSNEMSWEERPLNIQDYSYLSPSSSETSNSYITLGTNKVYDNTTKKVGIQKYVDFTEKFNELKTGLYDIRILYSDLSIYSKLATFEKTYLNEYVEVFNTINGTNGDTVYSVSDTEKIITTLDEQFRPSEDLCFSTGCWDDTMGVEYNAIANIKIKSDGNIILLNVVSVPKTGSDNKKFLDAKYISLCGISYVYDSSKSQLS